MNNTDKSLHDEKVDSLALTYVQDGFDVLKEPSASQLPFDLGGYRPDLIAIKGDGGLIVEVKTSASRIPVDRFQSIAQEISKHPGWRFLLITLEDVDSRHMPTVASELPTWLQLKEKLKQAEALVEAGSLEPAVLYLWSIFEAALRKQAIAQNIPIERFPATKLLNHMYSQGEVSVEQLDLLREFMNRRNRIAHGANDVIDASLVSTMIQTITDLLLAWSEGEPA